MRHGGRIIVDSVGPASPIEIGQGKTKQQISELGRVASTDDRGQQSAAFSGDPRLVLSLGLREKRGKKEPPPSGGGFEFFFLVEPIGIEPTTS